MKPSHPEMPGRFISSGGDQMVNVGEQAIEQIMTGDMGIKTAAIGDRTIYVRPGGYFYLELTMEKED